VLVAWDLFYINAYNTWDVEALYPLILLLIAAAIIIYGIISTGPQAHLSGKKHYLMPAVFMV